MKETTESRKRSTPISTVAKHMVTLTCDNASSSAEGIFLRANWAASFS